MAVDAGLDLVLPALQDLVDPLGIHQVLTAGAHAVQTAGGDLLRRGDGVHFTGADHGLGGEVLDVFDFRQVAVVRHVDRRMRPVPVFLC